MMCQNYPAIDLVKSFFKISQKMITKQGWPTWLKVRAQKTFPMRKKNAAEYGACLVCSLTRTSHQTIQQEASTLSFVDPLTPLAHQRRNCNKVSQVCSVINKKGNSNSIRPNGMCSFNVQGHPATVSSLIHWKHFLGFPEYFQISRNAL